MMANRTGNDMTAQNVLIAAIIFGVIGGVMWGVLSGIMSHIRNNDDHWFHD